MKRVVSILVIAAFLAAPMLVAAQQAPSGKSSGAGGVPSVESTAPNPTAPAPAEPAKAQKATAKKAETVTATGMVEAVKGKKGKVTGYNLVTDTETYMLKGKKVSAMVGKKVEATGTVSTAKGGKKVLTVKQVKEAM
jgi:Ni/Co efflux regulator RcnB